MTGKPYKPTRLTRDNCQQSVQQLCDRYAEWLRRTGRTAFYLYDLDTTGHRGGHAAECRARLWALSARLELRLVDARQYEFAGVPDSMDPAP